MTQTVGPRGFYLALRGWGYIERVHIAVVASLVLLGATVGAGAFAVRQVVADCVVRHFRWAPSMRLRKPWAAKNAVRFLSASFHGGEKIRL